MYEPFIVALITALVVVTIQVAHNLKVIDLKLGAALKHMGVDAPEEKRPSRVTTEEKLAASLKGMGSEMPCEKQPGGEPT